MKAGACFWRSRRACLSSFRGLGVVAEVDWSLRDTRSRRDRERPRAEGEIVQNGQAVETRGFLVRIRLPIPPVWAMTGRREAIRTAIEWLRLRREACESSDIRSRWTGTSGEGPVKPASPTVINTTTSTPSDVKRYKFLDLSESSKCFLLFYFIGISGTLKDPLLQAGQAPRYQSSPHEVRQHPSYLDIEAKYIGELDVHRPKIPDCQYRQAKSVSSQSCSSGLCSHKVL